MKELLLTDSFAHRLRRASTHHPKAAPRMAGTSLTASALHAAGASWEHTLARAAHDRTALLTDLSLFYARAQQVDHSLAHSLD
ncbi:hypothetical protein [Corynebacterium oculi]|uniref:Uncharacterized protein n=1 Tax=Corynebacterium oculi TaxID=1544416 RepID=A0A0Q0YLA6_9CORY|nr:hypothetical protein [Corynebacterium oculi]KQB83272.1 hypothetical protein Cocul_02246 [Corynebacterium oculi]